LYTDEDYFPTPKDMVGISDARMSGTAYGTEILHGAPEAAMGGPLALVRDGDVIAVDVEARKLHLCTRKNWRPAFAIAEA
jgi:dihydroxyacid dehydratase/phosphogluconate dehydratase